MRRHRYVFGSFGLELYCVCSLAALGASPGLWSIGLGLGWELRSSSAVAGAGALWEGCSSSGRREGLGHGELAGLSSQLLRCYGPAEPISWTPL